MTSGAGRSEATLRKIAKREEEEAAAAAVLDVEVDEATEAVADSILDLPIEDSVASTEPVAVEESPDEPAETIAKEGTDVQA